MPTVADQRNDRGSTGHHAATATFAAALAARLLQLLIAVVSRGRLLQFIGAIGSSNMVGMIAF